jgi:hypothetical protein
MRSTLSRPGRAGKPLSRFELQQEQQLGTFPEPTPALNTAPAVQGGGLSPVLPSRTRGAVMDRRSSLDSGLGLPTREQMIAAQTLAPTSNAPAEALAGTPVSPEALGAPREYRSVLGMPAGPVESGSVDPLSDAEARVGPYQEPGTGSKVKSGLLAFLKHGGSAMIDEFTGDAAERRHKQKVGEEYQKNVIRKGAHEQAEDRAATREDRDFNKQLRAEQLRVAQMKVQEQMGPDWAVVEGAEGEFLMYDKKKGPESAEVFGERVAKPFKPDHFSFDAQGREFYLGPDGKQVFTGGMHQGGKGGKDVELEDVPEARGLDAFIQDELDYGNYDSAVKQKREYEESIASRRGDLKAAQAQVQALIQDQADASEIAAAKEIVSSIQGEIKDATDEWKHVRAGIAKARKAHSEYEEKRKAAARKRQGSARRSAGVVEPDTLRARAKATINKATGKPFTDDEVDEFLRSIGQQ